MLKPFAFAVVLTSLISAQEALPERPDHETVVVRAHYPATETPFLLISPRTGPDIELFGAGQRGLGLDPTGLVAVPFGPALERDDAGYVDREFSTVLPDTDADLLAQVVALSKGGGRASEVFALAQRRTPNAGGDGHPSLAFDDAGQVDLYPEGRPVAVSRYTQRRLTRFRVDGRPLSGRSSTYREGWTDSDVGLVELLEPEMSGLSTVSSPEDFPNRIHCRIVTHWDDGTTEGGSATLIGAKHVITAGHCIYTSSKGWADYIEVWPGSDGSSAPFGSAVSVSHHSWSGWTSSNNYSYDMAVAKLDLPIGGATSWHGYGYDHACSHFKDNTFYMKGYPSETSAYDGLTMYKRSGKHDSCPTKREARFKRETYGGESGAGYYDIISGSRYVMAVHSHEHADSTSSDKSDNVRLRDYNFESVENWIDDSKPSTFDLQVANFNFTSSVFGVAKGSPLPSMQFKLHNHSKGDFFGNPQWTVRLSTNEYISTSDINCGTRSVSGIDLDAGKTVTINMTSSPPSVPSSTPSGYYYVGVLMTTTDADSGNQRTMASDVERIYVY